MSVTMSAALASADKCARNLRDRAGEYEKVAAVLRGLLDQDMRPASVDVVTLAEALLPLGLCIVHVEVVKAVGEVIEKVEPDDIHEAELLSSLGESLKLAEAGTVQKD